MSLTRKHKNSSTRKSETKNVSRLFFYLSLSPFLTFSLSRGFVPFLIPTLTFSNRHLSILLFFCKNLSFSLYHSHPHSLPHSQFLPLYLLFISRPFSSSVYHILNFFNVLFLSGSHTHPFSFSFSFSPSNSFSSSLVHSHSPCITFPCHYFDLDLYLNFSSWLWIHMRGEIFLQQRGIYFWRWSAFLLFYFHFCSISCQRAVRATLDFHQESPGNTTFLPETAEVIALSDSVSPSHK